MRTKLKKIFLYCATILILVGTSGFAAIAVSQLDLPKPRETFNSLAETEAIAYVFKKCLKSIPGNSGNYSFSSSKNTIFNGIQGDETDISAGAWLEDEITGEVDDGEIECHEGNDKILSLFANAIGLSKNDVLCNKDNNDYAGLIAKGSSTKYNYGCSGVAYSGNYFSYNKNAGDNTVYGQTYKNGEQYVKLLYDHWVKESGYAGWINYWDQLGNFDEAVSHRITSRDFGHNCGWHRQENDSGNNIVTIKNIWDDGTTSDNYYQYSSTKAVGNITGNATRTCSQLATRLNESFDAYSDAIKSIYQSDCQKAAKPAWDFEVQKAKIIVSGTKDPKTVTGTINGKEVAWSNFTTDSEGKQVVVEFTEKEKEDAQAVIDAQEALPFGGSRNAKVHKYYNTDKAPWTCTAPPEYEITSVSTNSQNEDQADCYDAGIESMAWIACPFIDNTTSAVDGLEKIIRDLLQIDTNKTFQDKTYEAWGLFRNIANWILIVIFLIIIFSQLTGYGIDNYGIKKMLPKLIVMAILINLSYFLCELVVDLSNILGIGLDNMFKSLGQSINGGAITGEESLAGIVAGLFGALAGAGAVAGTAITIAQIASGGGVMLVVSLILTLLVAIVAVLMFFVTLGARMVIVIAFTIISPVAFALYILPNTQSLFKKWWKIFQAALIVFPICGALYGMSYVIKAVVFGGGEVSPTMALVAVCTPFLPFLMIPSLLKSALAGLGVLGGTLATLGNGLKKGIGKGNDAFKNSDMYKEQKQENDRRRQELRAKGLADRLSKKQTKLRGQGKDLSDRDMRRLAGAHSTSDKLKREDDAARTILTDKEFGNKTEAELQNAWNSAFDSGDARRLTALTNVMTSRYGSGAANFMAKSLAGKNVSSDKNAQASMRALRDTMMQNSTLASNMKNKASDAFQMISNAGITGQDSSGNPTYEDLGYYSANNAISKDVKDWSTQSADTLSRAIDSGALTQETIGQILNSDDPAIQSSILSDPGKASILQAAMEGATNMGSMTKEDINKLAEQYKNKMQTKAKIISHGAYEDSRGNVYHLRQMDNGKYLDDSGFEVDITHFKQH